MRWVLDTDVLVAAVRSESGASRQILRAGLLRGFRWLVSVPLFIEYEAVLSRPEQLAASGLSAADVKTLLDAVAVVIEPIRLAFLWRPQLRDPNDDMVIEAAVNGRASGIVTFNQRDFVGADRFGLQILAPREALRLLENDP